MSKHYAAILFSKATGEGTTYNFRFKILKSNPEPFFRFLFTVLQQDANHSSSWTQDNQINDGCKIRINVYTPNELMRQKVPSNQIPFGQEILMGKERTPIINLVLTDILDDNQVKLHRLIPRYFQIIDSSIWNHYVPMVNFPDEPKKPDESDDIFHTLFTKAIDEIYDNYTKGVYQLEVAEEYADINARILQQSYLNGHHGMGVAPFIFHSEGYLKRLIDDKFKEKHVIDWICERKWRFLLVDDKANSSMSPFHDLKDGRLDTKLKIIKDRLESLFTDCAQFKIFDKETPPTVNEQCGILIESVSNIEEAKKALKERRYDIILLDYLLDKGENGGHEYGYDLLNDINSAVESHDHNYLIGPKDCFFFMFISAYPTAVQERLLAEGLNPHEDYWNINVGACPTNTPQLFSYNLLKFMERRLERLGISKLSPTKIIQQIHEIFSPTEGKTVREMADERYRDVLSLQYHYSKMVKDVEIPKEKKDLFNIGGSVLVTDFIQQKGWLKGFLEHLSHLVYLVAFGTTRQWAEMWEEYLYIRPQLNKLQSSCETKTMIVTKCIEQYISQLKRQQR